MTVTTQFEYLASRLHAENQKIRDSARRKMRELIRSPDPGKSGEKCLGTEQRAQIVQWTERLKPKDAAYMLVRMLNDPEPEITCAAKMGLLRLGLVALDKLGEVKISHPERLKMNAIEVVGEIASMREHLRMRAYRIFARFEQDPNPAVKQQVLTALDYIFLSTGKSRAQVMADAKSAFKNAAPAETDHAKVAQRLRSGL